MFITATTYLNDEAIHNLTVKERPNDQTFSAALMEVHAQLNKYITGRINEEIAAEDSSKKGEKRSPQTAEVNSSEIAKRQKRSDAACSSETPTSSSMA